MAECQYVVALSRSQAGRGALKDFCSLVPTCFFWGSQGEGGIDCQAFVILYNLIMPGYDSDTRPEAAAMQRDLLRQASPARKLAMISQMNRTVIALALAGLRIRHPHDSPGLQRRRLAGLLLGEDLAAKVYGVLWDED